MDLLDGEDDEPLLEPARDTQVGSGRLVDEVKMWGTSKWMVKIMENPY